MVLFAHEESATSEVFQGRVDHISSMRLVAWKGDMLNWHSESGTT